MEWPTKKSAKKYKEKNYFSLAMQILQQKRVRAEGAQTDRPVLNLKLRLMGTRRVQMKAVLSWLVRWAHHAGTSGFYPVFV